MQTNTLSVDVQPATLDYDDEVRRASHRRRFAAEYALGTEPPLHPHHCGPCADCAAFLGERRRAAVQRLYPVEAPMSGRRQRRTKWPLREQVLALDRRGMVRAAIADTLNVSDRRVADILGKSRTSENGGQKRLTQAKLFAA